MRRSFFDTNILLYLFDNGDPQKKARAQEVLREEVSVDRAVLSTQVLQEFYANATRKLGPPLPSEVAKERVRDFSRLPLVRTNEDMVMAAMARSRISSLSFWDALIVEAALKAGADRLFTKDLQHGQVIEGMRIENPFG